MKLSIITINYNNAEGLRKTLAYVAAQTYLNIEHIIVDGNSTDESVEVLEVYKPTPSPSLKGGENSEVTSSKLDYAAQKAAAAARRKKEKQIAEIEAAIAKLEQEQQAIENLLTDIANQTTENFQRYEHIKREMEQRLYEWEILSEEE